MNDLKVHVYIMCFNEEKILRYTINHYSEFCNKIFIIDNDSTDASVEIAKSYSDVTVIPFHTEGFNDFDNVYAKETFYKQYSRLDGEHYCGEEADFIIAVDMDEHIYHPNIMDVLKRYKQNGVTVPLITGIEMTSEEFPKLNDLLYKQIRRGFVHEVFNKPAVFSVDFDMTFSPGCHPRGAKYQEMLNNKNYKPSSKRELALLHFKHLGDNFVQRAQVNKNRLSDTSIKYGHGRHYLKSVNELQSNTISMREKSYNIFDEDNYVIILKLQNFLESIITRVRSDDNYTSPDILRDISICCEECLNDIMTASILMETARQLRPNGPSILKKLADFSNKLSKTHF